MLLNTHDLFADRMDNKDRQQAQAQQAAKMTLRLPRIRTCPQSFSMRCPFPLPFPRPLPRPLPLPLPPPFALPSRRFTTSTKADPVLLATLQKQLEKVDRNFLLSLDSLLRSSQKVYCGGTTYAPSAAYKKKVSDGINAGGFRTSVDFDRVSYTDPCAPTYIYFCNLRGSVSVTLRFEKDEYREKFLEEAGVESEGCWGYKVHQVKRIWTLIMDKYFIPGGWGNRISEEIEECINKSD